MITQMVSPVPCAADIGTDHGYIPIWLIRHGIADRVIAADLREGPLARAADHIREAGLEDRISLRMGDGLAVLAPGETNSIILAGMGGALMIRILSGHPEIMGQADELILQPQSEIADVRKYLIENRWCIADEEMTEDAGKYYTVMRAVHAEDEGYEEEEYVFGRVLLRKKHPVLREYLLRQENKLQMLLSQLLCHSSEKSKKRCIELKKELSLVRKALIKTGRGDEA